VCVSASEGVQANWRGDWTAGLQIFLLILHVELWLAPLAAAAAVGKESRAPEPGPKPPRTGLQSVLRARMLHSSSESRDWACHKPQCRVLQLPWSPIKRPLSWPLRCCSLCDPASLAIPRLLLLRT
jgi:hypothetical protein